MRDSKRIKKVMKTLEELWNIDPDMRFGQLFLNLEYFKKTSTWNAEEDEWLEAIKKMKRQLKKAVKSKKKSRGDRN